MAIDWHSAFQQHYGEFAHPLNPELKVKDFPTAVHLATASKFSVKSGEEGHASPVEAGMFWKEFQQLGMDPKDYLETLDKTKGLSFRLLNRPPTMNEIALHKDAPPHQIRQYYEALPHSQYPEISAGDFIKATHKATYYAQEHLGRKPFSHEVAMFHSAGWGTSQIADHYKSMRPPDPEPASPAPGAENQGAAEGARQTETQPR
jgi:hypothetical protein